jgi:hypothetical protein
MRLLVLTAPGTAEIGGVVDGVAVRDLLPVARGDVFVVELGEKRGGVVNVALEPAPAVRAAWIVPHAAEIPPPPPSPWRPEGLLESPP